jgi:hypothetical protein
MANYFPFVEKNIIYTKLPIWLSYVFSTLIVQLQEIKMKSKNGVGMVELANVLIFCHGSFLGD